MAVGYSVLLGQATLAITLTHHQIISLFPLNRMQLTSQNLADSVESADPRIDGMQVFSRFGGDRKLFQLATSKS